MSTPSSDKRKNYHTVRYGTEGEIKFGHLHRDNELSGVMLRSGSPSSKGNHYITLDSSGVKDRTNGTICSSPGGNSKSRLVLILRKKRVVKNPRTLVSTWTPRTVTL